MRHNRPAILNVAEFTRPGVDADVLRNLFRGYRESLVRFLLQLEHGIEPGAKWAAISC